ncbi:hypothetical protein AVV36_gp044 [Pectobacterium bacteriophage PM2]|uniref:Chorismate mutase domain-containing protein n=1 Tax=Pectobacterium bacteriophage PM2 TaxID=1429794 RepID=A0A0A0Q0A7_9CAUD|nr:hypothetical protein AVV36_gp044 [Pectobacterium bacteriophage PM2]AHY25006.1 hypothetical protein PM2_044 [Pectobacterium bacteriophage PM2]
MSLYSLDNLRNEVSLIDEKIVKLLKKRFVITNDIGTVKKVNNIPIENLFIEADKLASIDPMLQSIFEEIFKVSKWQQTTM